MEFPVDGSAAAIVGVDTNANPPAQPPAVNDNNRTFQPKPEDDGGSDNSHPKPRDIDKVIETSCVMARHLVWHISTQKKSFDFWHDSCKVLSDIEKCLAVLLAKLRTIQLLQPTSITDSRHSWGLFQTLERLTATLEFDCAQIKSFNNSHDTNAHLYISLQDDGGYNALLEKVATHSSEVISLMLILDLGQKLQHPLVTDPLLTEEACEPLRRVRTGQEPISITANSTHPEIFTGANVSFSVGEQALVVAEYMPALVSNDPNIVNSMRAVVRRLWARTNWHAFGDFDNNTIPYATNVTTGILPCLGYKDDAVMFRLPTGSLTELPSLQEVITSDVCRGNKATLEYRLDIARQLAESVFMLNTAGVGHRNIRSGSFRILKRDAELPLAHRKSWDAPRTQSLLPRERPYAIQRRTSFISQARVSSSAEETHEFAERLLPEDGEGKHHIKEVDFSLEHVKEQVEIAHPKGDPISQSGPAETQQRYHPQRKSESRQTDSQLLAPNKTTVVLMRLNNAAIFSRQVASDASMYASWADNVYRHPSQQDMHTNPPYHMGHDLYSLGVCLLEVGMWECLTYSTSSTTIMTASPRLLAEVDSLRVKSFKEKLAQASSEGDLPAVAKGGIMKYATSIMAQSLLTAVDDCPELDRHMKERVNSAMANKLRSSGYMALQEDCLPQLYVGLLANTARECCGEWHIVERVFTILLEATIVANVDGDMESFLRTTASRLRAIAWGVCTAGSYPLVIVEKMEAALDTAVKEKRHEMLLLATLNRLKLVLDNLHITGPQQNARPAIGIDVGARIEELANMDNGDTDLPEDDLESLMKTMEGRQILQNILVKLANDLLPVTMGTAYTDLVVKCLTAVEGSFNGAFSHPFYFGCEGEESTGCLLVERDILAPLRRMCMAL